jgi:hypothetical protein
MWRDEKPRMQVDPAILGGIVALLNDKAALTRRYALTILAESAEHHEPDDEAAARAGYALFPALILRDEKESVRELAADTLGAIKAAQEHVFGDAFPASDEDRLGLLAALTARGGAVKDLVLGLKTLLARSDLSAPVRAAAIDLTGGFHGHARPLAPMVVLQLSHHDQPEVIAAARKALERIVGQV